MHANVRLAASVLLFAVGIPANAAEVETARMTWTEIRDAVAAGETTIIIPTGGTEQNGPHMITGKHNLIVAELARRIAAKLGDALVAPVLAYTPEGGIAAREGHMAYPGTISIPPETFAKVIEAAAASFHAHGFKTIVFLGDSGPNQAPQREIAANLSQRWAGDGTRVVNADTYYAANGQVDALKADGETDASIGLHAGIRDTSELMAVDASGVRLDLRAAGKDGVSGDPARATAERGEKLLALKVAAAVKDIQNARAAPAGSSSATSKQDGSLFDALWRMIFG